MWTSLLAALPNDPDPRLIVQLFARERQKHKWGPSSVRTHWGALLGAGMRIPRLAHLFGKLKPQILRDVAHRLEMDMFRAMPGFTPAIDAATMNRAIQIAKIDKRQDEAAFLVVWWASVARPSDLLELHPRNVERVAETQWEITFVRGKGVVMRGQPYTLTIDSGPYHSLLQSFLKKSRYPVFSEDTMKRAVSILREMVDKFDVRMVRRGSARTMAQAGATLEQIRVYTGHTTNEQLLRYLAWGRFLKVRHKAAAKVSRLLWE